jgi:hypothetical protein
VTAAARALALLRRLFLRTGRRSARVRLPTRRSAAIDDAEPGVSARLITPSAGISALTSTSVRVPAVSRPLEPAIAEA